MSRLQALTGKKLLSVLLELGFEILPMLAGETIGPGLLNSILRQVKLSHEELKKKN